MDQNELEGMAERCGWGQGNTWDDCMCCSTFDLETFAKLVAEAAASKEREACAKLMLDSQHGGIGASVKAAYLIRERSSATSRGTEA